MENWDDLRILHAVVRGGSITSGAELLGVDQSTISRRLQAFEKRLGRTLFHDTKKRNQLTPFGEICAKAAHRLETEMSRLNNELRINDQGFEGAITIRTGDVLSDRLLLSTCSNFLEKFPKINLQISRQDKMDRGLETDIGIFATNAPSSELFGRKLAVATFASYASPDYLKAFQHRPEDMSWLNWNDGSGSPTWPALSPHIPDENCRLRCTNVDSILDAARLGIGATILPCFIGEIDPSLSRVTPGEIVSKREVWVFLQPDTRKSPKVRAFVDHLYSEVLKRIDVIEAL